MYLQDGWWWYCSPGRQSSGDISQPHAQSSWVSTITSSHSSWCSPWCTWVTTFITLTNMVEMLVGWQMWEIEVQEPLHLLAVTWLGMTWRIWLLGCIMFSRLIVVGTVEHFCKVEKISFCISEVHLKLHEIPARRQVEKIRNICCMSSSLACILHTAELQFMLLLLFPFVSKKWLSDVSNTIKSDYLLSVISLDTANSLLWGAPNKVHSFIKIFDF